MKIDPSIAMAFIGMSCGSGWIVEQHGGTVALESVLGELTRAVTRLPLA